MSIIDIIDNASKEYVVNGRTDEFVQIEDSIVNSQNMVHLYWFARYAQGANVERLQDIMLKDGRFEECFYFAKYVRNADIKKFIQKAIDDNAEFWVHKFVSLALSPFKNNRDDAIAFKNQLEQYRISFESKRRGSISGLKKEDIDDLIEKANEEYDNNGRTKVVVHLEKDARFTTGTGADTLLFAKFAHGANIKNLEKSMVLHGDPFNIMLFAQDVKNADYKMLLTGLELAQRDYVTIEEKEKSKIIRAERLKRRLREAINSQKSAREIQALRDELRQVEAEESYSILVKRYKRRIMNMASQNYDKK